MSNLIDDHYFFLLR